MPNYNDPIFWRQQKQLLAQEMADVILRIMFYGGAQAADVMPDGLSVLIDWDVFNEDAIRWMEQYLTLNLVKPVDGYALTQTVETTRRQTVEIIENWIRSGEDMRTLERRLEPVFGRERARRIATTEVTNIYSAANKMAWKSSGVVNGMRWRTARDDRVCPICGPLHNTIVDIDAGWTFTPAMLEASPELARALRGPQTVLRPPAHVGCRCALTPIVFESMLPQELKNQRFDERNFSNYIGAQRRRK